MSARPPRRQGRGDLRRGEPPPAPPARAARARLRRRPRDAPRGRARREEFATRLRDGGGRASAPHTGKRPASSRRLVRLIVRRRRPAILHTHLVHADFHGLPAGRLARVPVLVSTKHGFNAFRDGRAFAVADRRWPGSPTYTSRSPRARALPRGERGVRPRELRDRPLRDRGRDRRRPAAGCAAARGRRSARPDQGARRPPPGARADRGEVPGLRSRSPGDGPLDAELRAASSRLGLDDVVSFVGQVAPATPVFERAEIVVVPSHGEGFGMVALEAMERGRPVVASAVGGLRRSSRTADGAARPVRRREALAGGDRRARRGPVARGRDGAPPAATGRSRSSRRSAAPTGSRRSTGAR